VKVVGHQAVGEEHVRILVAGIVKQMEELREVRRLSEKKTAIIAFGHDVI
jgi:coenzyme F420-reducing hydrogenase gamma subunit